jgi:hypothetical protein
MVRTEVTFAEACEEYLRWLERDRQRKPSTPRTHLAPFLGGVTIEQITPEHVDAGAAQLAAPWSGRSRERRGCRRRG